MSTKYVAVRSSAAALGAQHPQVCQLFGAPAKTQLRTVAISAADKGWPLGICEPRKQGPVPCNFQTR